MNTLLHTLEEIPPWEKALAIAGIITAFWGHIAAIGRAFVRLFIATIKLDDGAAAILMSYLNVTGKQFSPLKYYITNLQWIRAKQRSGNVAQESVYQSGGFMLTAKNQPLWASFDDGAERTQVYDYTIHYLRGTLDFDTLMSTAVRWNNDMQAQLKDRFEIVYHHGKSMSSQLGDDGESLDDLLKKRGVFNTDGWRVIGYRPEDLGRTPRKNALQDLTLPPNAQAMVARIKRWLVSKEWYLQHHIGWRQGFMVHGRPGTGKTSVVRALAEEQGLPIHVMDIATLTNSELREAWQKCTKDAPCIILIEDIDGVFDERTNVGTGSLTFDALLNCIDGVEQANGVLLFVTTNNLDMVDDALQNRPGRIDAVVEFTYPDEDGRAAIAGRFVDERRARQIARDYPDASPAKVVEVCCREAVAEHFAKDATGATAVELKPEVERKR